MALYKYAYYYIIKIVTHAPPSLDTIAASLWLVWTSIRCRPFPSQRKWVCLGTLCKGAMIALPSQSWTWIWSTHGLDWIGPSKMGPCQTLCQRMPPGHRERGRNTEHLESEIWRRRCG